MDVRFGSLLKRRLPHAVLLAVAFSASDLIQWWDPDLGVMPLFILSAAGIGLLDNLSCLLVLVVALTAIQASMSPSNWRLVVMLAAVVAVGIVVPDRHLLAIWRHLGWPSPLPELDFGDLHLYLAWDAIASGTLLAIFYEWQARADRVAEAMRSARIASEIIEWKILDARLSSLKAKVDPKLLFAVVERAQILYQRNVNAAESLLEALIEFLRASLPQSQTLSVTLEQEATLCERFLALHAAMRDEKVSHELRVDPMVAGHYFPPAVLLPLVQALLTSAMAAPRPRLSIAADCLPDRLRIDLTSAPEAVPLPGGALDTASSALRRFFGECVSIVATVTPSKGHLTRIEVRGAPKGAMIDDRDEGST